MSGFDTASNILLIVRSGNKSKDFEPSLLDPIRKEASLDLNDPDFDRELVSIASKADEVNILDFTPDAALLQKLFNVMHSKGKIVIADRGLGQSIILELQLCGFVDVMVINDPTRNDDKFIVGQRPSWNIGEAAPVSIKIKKTDSQHVNTSWKMSNVDLAEDDLVDENELLNDNIQIPAPAACGDESTSGKKRACKNCTCGLAEQELQEAGATAPLSEEQKVIKASACGNCYKGDAFRCGSCPFLGKPAFEPGLERVVLSLGDDI